MSERKFNRHQLGILVLLAISGQQSAFAQQTASSHQAKADEQVEKLEVKGIRSSIKESLFLKQNATSVVDVVVAEDIGKFPDENLAEALGERVIFQCACVPSCRHSFAQFIIGKVVAGFVDHVVRAGVHADLFTDQVCALKALYIVGKLKRPTRIDLEMSCFDLFCVFGASQLTQSTQGPRREHP